MNQEKIKKSVKISNTVYDVEIHKNELITGKTIYPLSGYGNNYGTEYRIIISDSKKWSRTQINCWNDTYATRGHSMTASWIEGTGFLKRKEAEQFFKEVREKLLDAEDQTPDIKEIFELVKSKVEDSLETEY